jgi:anaerobic magnesium-protoporphyrin IX monomethyl ester cyclase
MQTTVKKLPKSDIVFVFPPAHGNPGTFRQHLGVAYLRAALAPTGITTDQYCSERPGSIEAVTREILARRPGMVGFTVYDSNYPTALAIARSIKSQRPGVIVVFGGPTATFSATEILKRTDVIDACVLGEAEETGPTILGRLLDGADLAEGTTGLAFRRGDSVFCGPLPPLVGSHRPGTDCSLDTTPSPYLTGILSDGRAGVLTGRGCTHHCQYCAFAALGRKTLRLHSVGRVLAELESIAEIQRLQHRHSVIPIHDDTFTLLVPRAKALCRALIERKLGLLLSCITRADSVDEELLRLLREAGFVGLAFGLESAVPQVLRATGKVRPPEWPDPDLSPEKAFVRKVRTSVVAAKKYGFNVGVSIILGLPTETVEQGAYTLRFVRRLPINYYMHNYLWLFPGTPLWDSRTAYGLDCTVDELGLPRTSKYAYDVGSLRPQPRCSFESDARIVRLLAADAMFSCATSPVFGPGTEAIVLDGAELTAATAAWARSVLDIGGLLMQILPPLGEDLLEQQLARDRLLLAEELVPVRHHVHVLPRRSRSMAERWLVTCAAVEIMEAHKPHLLTLSVRTCPGPLQDWLEGRDCKADFCEVNGYLAHPREINRFLRGVRGGELLASISRMPIPPEIKYVGRWLKGATPCRNLSRLEVDSSGCVRCCCHGDPIGHVGDPRQKLKHRISAAIRRTEAHRGCVSCSLGHCPRCPFPGIPDDTYCSIMKSQARALEFLGVLHICSRLPVLLACLQERSGDG